MNLYLVSVYCEGRSHAMVFACNSRDSLNLKLQSLAQSPTEPAFVPTSEGGTALIDKKYFNIVSITHIGRALPHSNFGLVARV